MQVFVCHLGSPPLGIIHEFGYKRRCDMNSFFLTERGEGGKEAVVLI